MPNPYVKMTEADLLNFAVSAMDMAKIPYIRNNSFCGVLLRPNGTRGFIRNSSHPGSPDLFIFLDKGVTIHCELKSDTGRQSSDQKLYQKNIEKRGHRYELINNSDDFLKLIGNK
jgi:hypothetical protein